MAVQDHRAPLRSSFGAASEAYPTAGEHTPPKAVIESHVRFIPVPVGLAGPLRISASGIPEDEYYAPLATVEPTLVASCSRGCKALTESNGLRFKILREGMARAPVFTFHDPEDALASVGLIPAIQDQLTRDARSTSRFAHLQALRSHVIDTRVHLAFDYINGEAAGQDVVTVTTQAACDLFLASIAAKKLRIRDFAIEGDMASDKKASRRDAANACRVQVIAWGELTNDVCERVLECTTERLHQELMTVTQARTRNGGFGCTVDAANVMAAMFTACGQDAASVMESSWMHLTPEYDAYSKDLKLSLFCPDLPVDAIGESTISPPQKASLELLKCRGPGSKSKVAGLVASFCLALDVGTAAATASGNFTHAHRWLARDEDDKSRLQLTEGI
ncbi:hypothetical protein E8E12_000420 [Didymella heteroderae]|uniref:Hydroxymethylglutaryl-CoA reductase (NADPH) n=1 Tax=Didymella heteroderae TaxID=1769908 RepID=A0A9P4WFX6_9PLEO|nr:hypothetical protein E8E12_000420 [Didymella heteroderae]